VIVGQRDVYEMARRVALLLHAIPGNLSGISSSTFDVEARTEYN